MATSSEEMELLKLVAEAGRRKKQLEGDDFNLEDVGEGALEGAGVAAATLPPVAMYARSRLNSAGRAPRLGHVPTSRRGRAAASIRGILDSVAESAARNPKLYATLELGAGAAAGAGSEIAGQVAENADATPTQKHLAELGGGLAAGMTGSKLVTGTINGVNRMIRWGMQDLGQLLGATPLTGWALRNIPVLKQTTGNWLNWAAKQGGESRAAKAIQAATADPQAAAAAAVSGPAGVSPARATGEEGLMAMQARIMADDPAYAAQVQRDLESAVATAQGDLASLYATPKGRADWEQAVIQRVAAPGTIVQKGSTDDMLEQAYGSFETMYDPVKGLPMRTKLFSGRQTDLGVMLKNVANTKTTMAGDADRKEVSRWLEGKMGALRRRANSSGFVQSDDLIKMRSDIRTKARQARASNPDRADLLDLAEEKVTSVLKSQMDRAQIGAMSAADRLYGMYKTVEDAAYRAGDKLLKPDNLLASLKRSATSRSSYARGEGAEMRALAQTGREPGELLEKPDVAANVVKDMTPAQRTDMQASVAAEMMRRSMDKQGIVDGASYLASLRANTPVLKNLGADQATLHRMDYIGRQLRMMQKPSPQATARLMSDGPNDLMQFLATLLGSKIGSEVTRLSGTGRGGGMAIPAFFTKRYRALVDTITADRAADLLVRAQSDPQLFAALLTKKTASTKQQADAMRIIGAWIGVPIEDASQVGGDALDKLRDEMGGEEQ